MLPLLLGKLALLLVSQFPIADHLKLAARVVTLLLQAAALILLALSVFRAVIPAAAIAKHFDDDDGRPVVVAGGAGGDVRLCRGAGCVVRRSQAADVRSHH